MSNLYFGGLFPDSAYFGGLFPFTSSTPTTTAGVTTTPGDLRDLIAALVTATVPALLAKNRFLESKYETDFEEWCQRNPDACFRRFSVRNTFNFFQPEMSNTDVEEDIVDFELIVGYPSTYRYGSHAAVDMDAAIQSDKILLKNAVGLDGYGNFTTLATFMVVRASTDIQRGDGVTFLRMVLPYRFFRSNT